MEQLEEKIKTLILTPHHQPNLVKEVANRILTRSLKPEIQAKCFKTLKPVLVKLIQYCDTDDPTERSLFNDYLNSVILAFQNQNYVLILHVLVEELVNNGSARRITVALTRIPHLIRNIQPIELGCDPQKLLKALIEIARRSDDESVQKALDTTLKCTMPYLDYYVWRSKEAKELQFLMSTLMDLLIRNLQAEASQVKRIAASSIASICSISENQYQNTLVKLNLLLNSLTETSQLDSDKYVGFCLCVKELPRYMESNHLRIVDISIERIQSDQNNVSIVVTSLEILREILLKYQIDYQKVCDITKIVYSNFLVRTEDGVEKLRDDIKVILQSNALSIIAAVIRQQPRLLDSGQISKIFEFDAHSDVAIRNQLISIRGNYIEASWRFPRCIERSVDCERIRKFWVEIRLILSSDKVHQDTLKTCVTAMKTCLNTLMESDHCLHIIEYQDFDRLIQLYQRSTFKPFKVEVLNLFAGLNYRTLYYLERHHWSKLRYQTASSLLHCLQDRIVNDIFITSLTDEHQKIRLSATATLISVTPKLYITNINNGSNRVSQRSSDPIVSLANDLADEHLIVLKHADEQMCLMSDDGDSLGSTDVHHGFDTRNRHKFLTSSIIQHYDNPYNDHPSDGVDICNQQTQNTAMNLKYIIGLLKSQLEASLERGKRVVTSLVKAIHEFTIAYPVYQYVTSWDCRPSEYCECFTLLNFLLTYLENSTEPDVIVEDLEAYRLFLSLSHQLLYALCHESVSIDYENQRMKPYHVRATNTREGSWSELSIKQVYIANIYDVYFTHLVKLLRLICLIVEERSNPFVVIAQPNKGSASSQQQLHKSHLLQDIQFVHETLVSNGPIFGRIGKKLEQSYESSKKNLNQNDEKFFQTLETCLNNLSSLLEFMSVNKSLEYVRDILGCLGTSSSICNESSLICARQLLKSLFGINIIAIYQVDPIDWFEEETSGSSTTAQTPSSLMSSQENQCSALQGVYHHLVSNSYKIFSSYHSTIYSQITPISDKTLTILNFESRRALKVRKRIDERVKSLFETNPYQLVHPKIKQISEILRSTIADFTSVVTESMSQFESRGFCSYQSEILHFMSYLLLLRVNYRKLPLADKLLQSVYELLDKCGELMFLARENGIEYFLRNSFTFITLLSYERGPSKQFHEVAQVIQKLDDLRAKLSMASATERDITTYVVPSLRCLVEDLFIYRTEHFQNISYSAARGGSHVTVSGGDPSEIEMADRTKKDMFEALEAERETVAKKLLGVIDNPGVYDLLSILILESRRDSSEIKYKKLSQHLLSIIPNMLSRRGVDMTDYNRIELTRRIIENISPEMFHPVNFIFETLLVAPKPAGSTSLSGVRDIKSIQEFQRWMSLVIITIHILTTQVEEQKFLSRLLEIMSEEVFVKYLLQIAQICLAEIFIQLESLNQDKLERSNKLFLVQQLSSYILYLTHMFQSGLFLQLSKSAAELVRIEIKTDHEEPKSLVNLIGWARDPNNNFSLSACELMFYHIRLIYPDLTIYWCNVMMLLNNVDCNRDYWRNLLVYECHQCSVSQQQQQQQQATSKALESLNLADDNEPDATVDDASIGCSIQNDNEPTSSGITSTGGGGGGGGFKRSTHINRPSSLNLSDVSFNDQLRRSFIKKIATSESRDKALNRNIIESNGENGQLLEREVTIGNTEQCLAPNIELTRRGALCLVLDFVSISMNDVEHITWLIIHHINDIIRWSHEMPVAEFVNAVHGNSASSGIFIQSVNSNFSNITSISFVTRLLWTLEQVHYTQYGSLVVLLVEKLLSSMELAPYRSMTTKIEEFACETVDKLLNETNKSLVTTNDEVMNQLTSEDLDKIIGILDEDLYPKLTKLLKQLRQSSPDQPIAPAIELHEADDDNSDLENMDGDELETLYSKANVIYWLAEQGFTGKISTLTPALKTIRILLSEPRLTDKINKDQRLVCFLVSAIYSLALTILPPPTRLAKPKFWLNSTDDAANNTMTVSRDGGGPKEFNFDKPNILNHRFSKPEMPIGSKRPMAKPTIAKKLEDKGNLSKEELIEEARLACLEGLFLHDNIFSLQATQFGCLDEIVIRLARLPMINSFILTPPSLWRNNIWPAGGFDAPDGDEYRIRFPVVTHEVLLKDYSTIDNFCDRILRLGWINRRQFEEIWMTLIGVLSTMLSSQQPVVGASFTGAEAGFASAISDDQRRTNLRAAINVITTLTKFLAMARKTVPGDPLAADTYPAQSFDERVYDLTKAIGTNLTSLRKKTKDIFEKMALEKKSSASNNLPSKGSGSQATPPPPKHQYQNNGENYLTANYNYHLKIPAQKLRMSSLINAELSMQDTVLIESDNEKMSSDEIDLESCIRLLLSIYKQKLKDPNEDILSSEQQQQQQLNTNPSSSSGAPSQSTRQSKASSKSGANSSSNSRTNQLAPPLTTAICQSILALSDLFADYDQFDWLFETFVSMFKLAEKNEDEIQMQYLIVGLCKSTAIRCYEVPSELTSVNDVNHRSLMFEKCRQCMEKCLKSSFGPLRENALHGIYYMLEDSINIVASGAWELDDFKLLRQSRLTWILRLMPIILDKENAKLLTRKSQTMKLLEYLCETVSEFELKSIKI